MVKRPDPLPDDPRLPGTDAGRELARNLRARADMVARDERKWKRTASRAAAGTWGDEP